jgi:hypothetical protein
MKTLKEKIEVMQAALEGKEIEVMTWDREEQGWGPPKLLTWNWREHDYRVKEEKALLKRKKIELFIDGLPMFVGFVFSD